MFRLDRPGWRYAGWCCNKFGRKYPDMPEDVVDCAGVSIGAKLTAVDNTKHSRSGNRGYSVEKRVTAAEVCETVGNSGN